jgi:hypothetical protein
MDKKEYYNQNKDYIIDYVKSYYKDHKEQKSNYSKEYYKKNKDNINYKQKRKTKNIFITISHEPVVLYF